MSNLLTASKEYTDTGHHGNRKGGYDAPETKPIIDEWLSKQGVRFDWPDGHRFGLCLTHDVDYLRYTAHVERLRAFAALRGVQWKNRAILLSSALRHGARALLGGTRYFPLDIWTDVEAEFGFRSTFFFMSGPPQKPHANDGYYTPNDKVLFHGRLRQLSEVLPELTAGGWEVGLHGSIASAFDVQIAQTERLRLSDAAKVNVISGRQHYLNFDIRTTPAIHEKAGLQVDSSLGSNVLPVAFRIGTGMPFPMFDRIHNRSLNLTQIPLTVHDNPLLAGANGDESRAVANAARVLQDAADRGSLVTFLFHPNYFQDATAFRVYRQILEIAKSLGAWGCSAGDAAHWCARNLAIKKKIAS